jgi:hypothetical protein
MCEGKSQWVYRKPYAGATADNYRRFSEAGLAPEILDVTDTEIEVVCHQTLEAWLDANPSPEERAVMKNRIRCLLRDARNRALSSRFAHRQHRGG